MVSDVANKTLIIRVTDMGGECSVVYDHVGRITEYRSTLDMTKGNESWLMEMLLALDMKALKANKRVQVIEVLREVSFDDFYGAYAVKEARAKAEAAWGKLSKAQQLMAFNYINKYKRKLEATGVAPAYPASYLNGKRWLD